MSTPGAGPLPDSEPGHEGPSRRQVLTWAALGAAGVGALGAAGVSLSRSGDRDGGRSTAPWPRSQRMLVVVELGGGNDGLSTLVPIESGRYHDLRPDLALSGDDVIGFADGWGLNSRLEGLSRRGLTVMSGVGTADPDLSHFDMMERWHRGSPDPISPAEKGSIGPGFLGRLCDAVAEPGEFAGLSLRFGEHPLIRSATALTTGLGDMSDNALADEGEAAEVRALLSAFADGGGSDRFAAARSQLGGVVDVLDMVRDLPTTVAEYPDTEFGRQLAFASQVVQADSSVRVLHVPMGVSSYDTHSNHAKLHAGLMVELNDGLSTFVDDLTDHGVVDDVLIATTSEFGRRPEQHGDGLDHGTASSMLLMGPTNPGLHGEPSSLDQLDELDNLVASVEFDRYYATLASWLEVDPAQVLSPRGGVVAAPLPGLLRT